MRITGGEFGGLILKVPKTDALRPTQDRVREAIFNIIRSEVEGSDFLDLFAGSGAVGIEALSRGARSATFVERDRRHLVALKENLAWVKKGARCGMENVIAADVYRYLANYSGAGYTIAFADPPYALGEEKGYVSVLTTLAERGIVRAGGLFIAEMTAVQLADEANGWELIRDRTYGKTKICIWRRNNI